MHPQIRQVGPGSCPICGMTLEPVEISAEAGPNHELADMSRRFWIGLVLTLPVVVLEMGSHVSWLGLGDLVPERLLRARLARHSDCGLHRPAVWGPAPALAFALIAAVSVVIIASPCALGLATPMSIMAAVGKGAGAGVLIKSAESLERMEKVDTLVVNKTGTLTEGKPRVTAVVPAAGLAEDDVLRPAASLERSSEHPLAAAVMAAARENGITAEEPADFASVTGKGVCSWWPPPSAACGSRSVTAWKARRPTPRRS